MVLNFMKTHDPHDSVKLSDISGYRIKHKKHSTLESR
jgi:hypothetical protein